MNDSPPYKSTIPFTVRSYECDERSEVTIAVICNYFQEAAGIQADELDFDVKHLNDNGLTWVLHRQQVAATRFPERWEKIKVDTWPSSGDGLRAFRDYEISGSSGETIAKGLSQWMMIDLEKRRPVRIPDELMKYRTAKNEHVLEINTGKLQPAPLDNARHIVTSNSNHLDMNNHVNNVHYVDWLSGNYGTHTNKGKCYKIDIEFRRECGIGESILLADSVKYKTLSTRSLYSKSEGHLLASAHLHFK